MNESQQDYWFKTYLRDLRDSRLSYIDVHMLGLLRFRAHKGACDSSLKQLQEDLGRSKVSLSGVKRSLARLVELGLIDRQKRGHGRTSLVRVLPPPASVEKTEVVPEPEKTPEKPAVRAPVKTGYTEPQPPTHMICHGKCFTYSNSSGAWIEDDGGTHWDNISEGDRKLGAGFVLKETTKE